MNHPFSEEDIIRFIRGEMLENEQQSIENELITNQNLAKDVNELKVTLAAVDSEGEHLLKERFKKLEKRNILKKWISIIFGLIVIFLLSLILKKIISDKGQNYPERMYATYFEKYREPVNMRKASTPKIDFNNAVKAYRNNEYGKAQIFFNKGCNGSNLEACFYASLSAIYNNEIPPEKAKILLEQNNAYTSIILWNEALFFLKNGNLSDAESSFKKLIANGSYKKAEAIEIVDELEKIKR